jgi:uncharacterized protein (DUF433 family)
MQITKDRKKIDLAGLVWTDPERMSGVPCFKGTRVPVQNLFDYLEGGESIESFLDDFEGVTREQAMALIEVAAERVVGDLEHA